MHTRFHASACAAALLLSLNCGLSAQIQTIGFQSSGSSLLTTTSDAWYATVTVTAAAGISIHGVDMYGVSTGADTCSLHLRPGAVQPQHRGSSAGWTLIDTVTLTSPVTGWAPLDFADLHLAPGTYGIAVSRSAGNQSFLSGPQVVANADLSLTGAGATDQLFVGSGADHTFIARVRYSVGPIRTVGGSARIDGVPSLTPVFATADLDGQTGGPGGFLHRYVDGAQVTVSAPATSNSSSGTVWLQRWEVDGVAGPVGATSNSFVVDADRAAVAYYESPLSLGVDATVNGAPGTVTVTASPADLLGVATQVTPGSFAFLRDQQVRLSAPLEINGRDQLRRWTVNGVEQPSYRGVATATVAAGANVVAEYETSPCFDGDFGAPLGLADDALAVGLPLGFDFPLPGSDFVTTDSIDVCSNGFIWLVSGASASSDPTPTGAEFEDLQPRLAPFWADLAFGSGADVYFRSEAGRAVITWHDATLQGDATRFTVQCQMFANGTVWFSWSGSVPAAGDSIVGVSEGGGADYPTDAYMWVPGIWTSSRPTAYDSYHDNFALQGIALSIAWEEQWGVVGHHLTCAAGNVLAYGSGCDVRNAFYEKGRGAAIGAVTLEMTPNARGGYDVAQGPGLAGFDSVLGSSLGLGDDAMATVSLPFAFAYPGNPGGSTAVRVSSNGFLWLDPAAFAGADHNPTVSEFLAEPARLAALWTDLNPASPLASGVFANVLADRVVITWHECPEFGQSVLLTVQCQLFADGRIVVTRVGAEQTVRDIVVGFSPGYGVVNPGASDLLTDLPLSTVATDHPRLDLAVAAGVAPVIGSSLPLLVTETTGSGLLDILAVSLAPVDVELGFLGAPGCHLLGSTDVLGVFLPTGVTTTIGYGLPGSPAWLGNTLYLQAVSFVPGSNDFGAVFSNGLAVTVGEQ